MIRASNEVANAMQIPDKNKQNKIIHTTPPTPSKKHEVDLKSSMYVLEKSGPIVLFHSQ